MLEAGFSYNFNELQNHLNFHLFLVLSKMMTGAGTLS